MFSQKHLLGTDEDETAEMSGEKFIFTHQSFTEMKEALNIIEEKDSGHLGQMKIEFDGKLLKIRIFYNNPVSNPNRCILIYSFKNKPDQQESKEVGYEHSDYSGSESDGSHAGWIVDCDFKTIQEFFSDDNTRIILEDVREKMSDEDEEGPEIGSLYLRYSDSLVESQSLLAPRERSGSLVMYVTNTKATKTSGGTKATMRHKVRISVGVREIL